MESIQEYLLMKIKTTERQRFNFRIPDIIEAMLKHCYRYVVESKKRAFEPTPETMRVIQSVASWLKDGKVGLILTGKCGTGKSIMLQAIALLIEYYNLERYPQYSMDVISATEICNLSRKDDDLSRFKRCRYLGIDDLGTESLTVKSWGTELSPVLDILYCRYDSRSITIITTNDTIEELQKKYGQRLYDRFCEIYDRIPFDFKSFRQN